MIWYLVDALCAISIWSLAAAVVLGIYEWANRKPAPLPASHFMNRGRS